MIVLLLVLVCCMYIDSVLLIIRPETARRTVCGLLDSDSAVFLWAGIAMVVGGLFFWAAPAAQLPLFFQVLGILALVKGLLLGLCFPKAGIALLRWWCAAPRWAYRVWGACAFALASGGYWAL